MKQYVKILSIHHLTHDVLRIVGEKPDELSFQPGQAVDFSIHKEGWEEQIRPFTFTSLPEDNDVEFTIKTYPSHHGVTNELLALRAGDEVILQDVFGDILYKGEGIFLAGGAGVTPFIAILKHLEKEGKLGNNKLIFANKAKEDIILEEKFHQMLGENFINVLSNEKLEGYEHGHITPEILKKHMGSGTPYFYLCGPEGMMNAMEEQLSTLNIPPDRIVKENF